MRYWIVPGFISLAVALVGCTAPESTFDPAAACEEQCTKTGQCGWAEEIDHEQASCENTCGNAFNRALEAGCDPEWESALRCVLRKYTCARAPVDPCKEEHDRLELCLGPQEVDNVPAGGADGSGN